MKLRLAIKVLHLGVGGCHYNPGLRRRWSTIRAAAARVRNNERALAHFGIRARSSMDRATAS